MIRTQGARARAALTAIVLAALGGIAQAQTVAMSAVLTGNDEVPPTGSPATGTATFTVDTVANTLTFNITFSGLVAQETAAHIHGFAPPGTNAGILFPLPTGSPKIGVWLYDQSLEAGILGGLTYVNVHSTSFLTGEIRGQIVAGSVAGQPGCAGDGTGTACPCGNAGATGEGCANSTGKGAMLMAWGTSSVAADDLVLGLTQLPPNCFAVVKVGDQQLGGGQGTPLGDGLDCVGGTQALLAVQNAGIDGVIAQIGPVQASAGALTAGSTWSFQGWYRDVPGTPCGGGFNYSNSVTVTFAP